MIKLELSNLAGTAPVSLPNEDGGEEIEKKIPYPKSVPFIIITELSERFSYYGMRAVLTIYLRNMLKFDEDTSTTLYHAFLLLCYGLPLIWGILADSYLGKYKTIIVASVLFACGNGILTLSSITPLGMPAIPLTVAGLFLMSGGTAGLKPCVAPFGAEQYILPQQAKYLQQFFSVFFFAVTIGNAISTIITPIFRGIECIGMESCYPLAFGVPASIMILALIVFMSGKALYKINQPEGNMLVKVSKCITHAMLNKKHYDEDKAHWLDYAEDKFDAGLINDIKMLLRVLVYYIPIPMFFALYEQLGSRWTLQASRMSGQIGTLAIKPDQMQVCNGIFMLIFLPVFQILIYPLFGKFGLLKRPLQRMGVGGFLAALSFGVAGIVEMQIEKNQYIPPTALETHIKFTNTLPCPIWVETQLNSTLLMTGPESSQITTFVNVTQLKMTLTLNESCSSMVHSTPLHSMGMENRKWEGQFQLTLQSLQTLFIFAQNNSLDAWISSVGEDFSKSNEGNAKIRLVFNGILPPTLQSGAVFKLKSSHENYSFDLTKDSNDFSHTTTSEIPPGEYSVSSNFLPWIDLGTIKVHPGGSYLSVVHPDYESKVPGFKLQNLVISSANEIHMLWLIPQYILMAFGEILFIVSGMEFSFTQAPKSMKSVLQSLWHLMNAFGNLIVIMRAQTRNAGSQASEFFLFSGAMLIDIIIFCLLAMRYTYVDGTLVNSIKDRNGNKKRGRKIEP